MTDKELSARFWEEFEHNHPATCLELVRQAEIRQPNYTFWAVMHGEMLRKLGRYAEARRTLESASSTLNGRQSYIRALSLARTLQALRDDAEAERAFERVTELWPDREEGFVFFASFLAGKGRVTDGCAVLERGLAVSGGTAEDQSEILLNLGLFFRALGNYSRAKEWLERAHAADPKDERAREALEDVKNAIDACQSC